MSGIRERLTQVKNELVVGELGFNLNGRTWIGVSTPKLDDFERIAKHIATTLLETQNINKVLVPPNVTINGMITEAWDPNCIDMQALYIIPRGGNVIPTMQYVLFDDRAMCEDTREQLQYSIVRLGRTKDVIEKQWHDHLYLCFNDISELKNIARLDRNTQCIVVNHDSNTCLYRNY